MRNVIVLLIAIHATDSSIIWTNVCENNRLDVRWLSPNFMPQWKMIFHTLPWAKLGHAALMTAGHWFEVIELFVAIRTKRLKLGNVVVKKCPAGTLFAEPHYLHVHIFSVGQNCIISFVKTSRIELTNKYRATWLLIWSWIPIAYKPLF